MQKMLQRSNVWQGRIECMYKTAHIHCIVPMSPPDVANLYTLTTSNFNKRCGDKHILKEINYITTGC